MKVALCYSGIYRHFAGWKENHKMISNHVDAIFYSTWENHPKPLENGVLTFPEPAIKYDPFTSAHYETTWGAGTPIPYPSRRKDLAKQLLAHQHMVDHLNGEYDIVIRMRYDTWFGNFDWQPFIQQAYDNQEVIAFGEHTPADQRVPNLFKQEPELIDIDNILVDFMIIHPANKMVNTFELYEEEKLFPANAGWHQVLVGQHGDDAKNYSGGVQLSRLVFPPQGLHASSFIT